MTADKAKKRLRIIRRLLRSRVFWILLIAVFVGWLGHGKFHPSIERVPVVHPENPKLVVLGKGLGGSGHLMYLPEGGVKEQELDAGQWTKTRIEAVLPANVQNGHVRVLRHLGPFDWASRRACVVVTEAGLPSRPYGYELPVEAVSPWPLFRRDRRNTGYSPLRAKYQGDRPWSFRTEKGIFSTPVIGGDGTVYVGSADHNFYAINPNGTEKWRYKTGELIDSAAALHRKDPRTGQGAVTFISGDGFMYHLSTDGGVATSKERVLWTFDAASLPGAGYNNWWEGNVAVGYDGTIYAGNTNWNYYAISPDGQVKWNYATGNNAWAIAAFDDDGTIYWSAMDTFVRAVAPDSKEKWRKRTLGFMAASAALAEDGTLYAGGFDSYFYALDARTGSKKWKFKTDDHIYSSAALLEDEAGATVGVYFGSTDGSLYCLSPTGEMRWRYDTGDPIRSSPVIGRMPEGEDGHIVYFGSGNGVLYALDAAKGTRRWSLDTTPDDPALRDRNDLNASPALGKTGVYIAGEHGYVWYVPYDYPLHQEDPRGTTDPKDDLPQDIAGLLYVTAGGTTLRAHADSVSPAAVLRYRLVVREGGETRDARLDKDELTIEARPDFDFISETSGDGRYLYIIPEGFLEAGTAYELALSGDYYAGGFDIGNLTFGGDKAGAFDDTFRFRTKRLGKTPLPLAVGENSVRAFEWTRLAVPLPPMLPSLNQIGFDYLDCIIAPVDLGPPDSSGLRNITLWMVEARHDEEGVLRACPDPDILIPLTGTCLGDSFIVTNRNFMLKVTELPVPFDIFQLRGILGPDMRVEPGATAYAETQVLDVPTFGPLLVLAGLANNVYEKLVVMATYITRPYPATAPSCLRPKGVSVDSIEYTPPGAETPGQVRAHMKLAEGAAYPLDAHRPALLLLDAEKHLAVQFSYQEYLTCTADKAGNLTRIEQGIPAGTPIPEDVEAIVILDAFPLHREKLE